MKKILKILSEHKYAILWSISYIAIMWIVLHGMFNFDMFSSRHWQYLAHAQLRGFPGFVFGILVLAALPLYIATTTIIIRTKKPLFSIPAPEFAKKIWARMQPTLTNPPSSESPDAAPEKESDTPKTDALPDELPSELRTAYIRARMNITPEQRSAFNQPTHPHTPNNIQSDTTPIEPELDEIPLPTDFDIPAPESDSDFSAPDFTEMPTPTFTDITFDDKIEVPTSNPVTEHLDTIGEQYETIDDVIITKTHAIASHTDDDFWVCDDEQWFASGKQKQSPISKLLNVATARDLTPVLYLGADNIMDLDTMCKTWESMGIKIIKSPTEISE